MWAETNCGRYIVEEYGAKGRLLKPLRFLYVKSKACIKMKDAMSDWSQITLEVSRAVCHVTLVV